MEGPAPFEGLPGGWTLILADTKGRLWVAQTDSPIWAAAPGQAAVFYDGERCLGGGRIGQPLSAAA